jgi:glucokinase
VLRTAEAVKEGRDELAGLGLGIAGFLSPEDGIVYTSPNIPVLRDTPIVQMLEEALGIALVLDNDANAVALGEHWLGAGKGASSIICITLGTGLGSGLILHNRVWHGTHGFAGELGHTVLVPGGLPCNCGQRGCLEAYVSATALVRHVREAVEGGADSSLAPYVTRRSRPLTAKVIATHAMGGDHLARRVFHDAGTHLGVGITNVLNLMDLERIIIGGGVATAGDLILRPTSREVRKRRVGPRRSRLRIIRSLLGDKAGPLGAARSVFLRASDLSPRRRTRTKPATGGHT